jgi:lambda family phage tail tape measure protein
MTVTPALRAQIDTLASKYVEAAYAADIAAGKIEEIQNASRAGAQGIADIFAQMATGAMSAEDATRQLIKQVIILTIKKRILAAVEAMSSMGGFGGILGGILMGLGGGFAEGGYTGDGGKHQPAGVVHRGEYVLSKAATKTIGVGNLEALHRSAKRGYSGGGLVGGSATRVSRMPARQFLRELP